MFNFLHSSSIKRPLLVETINTPPCGFIFHSWLIEKYLRDPGLVMHFNTFITGFLFTLLAPSLCSKSPYTASDTSTRRSDAKSQTQANI